MERFFRLNNGKFVSDDDIRIAHEINYGSDLNPKYADTEDCMVRYIDHLYMISLAYEIEEYKDSHLKEMLEQGKEQMAIEYYMYFNNADINETKRYINHNIKPFIDKKEDNSKNINISQDGMLHIFKNSIEN